MWIIILVIWLLIPAIYTGFVFANSYNSLEPQLPSGIPAGIKTMAADGMIRAEDNSLVVGPSKITRIYFESINSIKGYWAGSKASFMITYPYRASLNTSKDSSIYWGTAVGTETPYIRIYTDYEKHQNGEPYLEVNDHLQATEQNYHQWVNATARMTIVYPVVTESTGNDLRYTNQQTIKQHDLRLYVIPDQEFNNLTQHALWENARPTLSNIAVHFFVNLMVWGLILLLALGLLFLLRRRRQRKNRKFEYWR